METGERIEQKIAGVRQAVQYLHTIAIEQAEALRELQAENEDLRRQLGQKDEAYAKILEAQREAQEQENQRRDEERATLYDVLKALKKNRGNLARSKRDTLDEKGKLKKAWKEYDKADQQLKKEQGEFDGKAAYYRALEQQLKESQLAYETLKGQYGQLQKEFNDTSDALEKEKELREGVEEQNASIQQKLETAQQEKVNAEEALKRAAEALQKPEKTPVPPDAGGVQAPAPEGAVDEEDVASFVAPSQSQQTPSGGMQP